MFRTAPRWESFEAIGRVAALVDVRTSGQDWDIENAAPARVEEFVAAYEREALSVDERHALMKLIVASLDALPGKPSPALVERVRVALVRDYAIHFFTVDRWACLEDGEDDGYRVTPLMRGVYHECTPPPIVAALTDDLAGLELALAAGPAQGVLDDALLGAATAASAAVLERLLAAGADVHTRDEAGATPLRRAAGNLAALPVLLAAGADLNAADGMGWTTLHVATLNGELAAVRALLELGARVDLRDCNGYDALMAAVEGRRLELVELLLAHGARVTPPNNNGEDARDIARRKLDEDPNDPITRRIRLRLA